jgi:hypothetical protein
LSTSLSIELIPRPGPAPELWSPAQDVGDVVVLLDQDENLERAKAVVEPAPGRIVVDPSKIRLTPAVGPDLFECAAARVVRKVVSDLAESQMTRRFGGDVSP